MRRRKTKMDAQQEEEFKKNLQRHERDHFLGAFAGLNPEYMEMSESLDAYPHRHFSEFNKACIEELLVHMFQYTQWILY